MWFTLEAQVDDGTKANRYSVTKSAATIALMSVAVGAVAVTAGAAMLPAAATAGAVGLNPAPILREMSADIQAGGAAAAASYLSKASLASKALLTKNAGTIAKICTYRVIMVDRQAVSQYCELRCSIGCPSEGSREDLGRGWRSDGSTERR